MLSQRRGGLPRLLGVNWPSIRFLIGRHFKIVGGLAGTSMLSGFAEAGILAVIAQVAAALLDGSKQVGIALGPVDTQLSVETLIWLAVALSVLRLALQVLLAALPARLAAGVQADLRTRLFAAFTRASWETQSKDREGHLQEMLTSQAVQATMGTIQLATMISALLTFLVLVVSAMVLNPVAAIVVVAVASALFALLRPLSNYGQTSARGLSEAQIAFAGGVGEAVRMAEESRVFGVGQAQRERNEERVGAARDLFFRTQFVGRLVPSLFQGLIYLTVVAGLGVLYATDATQVASLGAVVLLLIRAGTYGQQVQSSYQAVKQALPFVERLERATDRYHGETDPGDHDEPLPAVERIDFDDVSFAYQPGSPVLSDVTFSVSKGEVVGIVGPSGAGKSTIVQVLLQLRHAELGTYSVNGVTADRYRFEDWHREVAYVPQEPRLIHASVAENIRYFREIDDEAVERAARIARIHDDVVGWQGGYGKTIGPRADSVSGGQQQRICLARALAGAPGMLVLDEPTSSLDPRSESLIQDSLRDLGPDVAVFIVTHRMSTLAVCDRVMVLVDGRLERFDTPDALERDSEYFRAALAFGGLDRPAPAEVGPQ